MYGNWKGLPYGEAGFVGVDEYVPILGNSGASIILWEQCMYPISIYYCVCH